MIPFNKASNRLRRLDEAEPERTRLRPQEFFHGGISARTSRLRRDAKSRRKTSRRLRSSRRVKLGV
jgi:hypothetical protein